MNACCDSRAKVKALVKNAAAASTAYGSYITPVEGNSGALTADLNCFVVLCCCYGSIVNNTWQNILYQALHAPHARTL